VVPNPQRDREGCASRGSRLVITRYHGAVAGNGSAGSLDVEHIPGDNPQQMTRKSPELALLSLVECIWLANEVGP
jgi:hypothetical protein